MPQQNVLITPTLLNSFEFAKNAPPSWKDRAMKDLIAKIRREKQTFPLWIKKGIAFEDAVYAACATAQRKNEKVARGSQFFQDVCAKCIGGSFQDVFKKTIEVNNTAVLLYNKTDVVFPDKIIDIKTTLKWKGPEKYLKGTQHEMYTYAAEKALFEYVVVQWLNEEDNTIFDVHSVCYEAPDKGALEDKIVSNIEALFSFLKEEGLYEDYYTIFSNNRR